MRKKRKTDLVNEFTCLCLRILVIAEELKSKRMIKYIVALSEEFFNNIGQAGFYDNPYQSEVWEAELNVKNKK